MKKVIGLMVVVAFSICAAGTALAASNPKKDAEGLVKKAVAFFKAHGKEKTFAEINNPKGQFVKGELYIFVNDFNGISLAHGGNQKLIGKNMLGLKDSDGKPFIQEFIKAAKQGGGWVDYKWNNPVTKKIEAKSSYIEPAGDIYFGCGIYK